MAAPGLPVVKVEQAPSPDLKSEPSEDGTSPFPQQDDIYEDPGDLDFSAAQQNLWLSHIPRSLWEALAQIEDDDEIEIGILRIEGVAGTNGRVSLKFHDSLPQLNDHPKEYNLLRTSKGTIRGKRVGPSYVFSEKDLLGYKSRPFSWDDLDEDGQPRQGRSYLYERHRRDQKKKEAKGRFQPYARKSIPKQTAIAGTVTSEFDCVPVQNKEYLDVEARRTNQLLKVPERQQATIIQGRSGPRPTNMYLTMAEKASINKQSLLRRQKAKDKRTARVERKNLINELFEHFKQHKVWALRDLNALVQQPEAYLREILTEIAYMHKQGDFSGKWQLRDEFVNTFELDDVEGEPDEDSDMASPRDEDEGNDQFEDVTMGGS